HRAGAGGAALAKPSPARFGTNTMNGQPAAPARDRPLLALRAGKKLVPLIATDGEGAATQRLLAHFLTGTIDLDHIASLERSGQRVSIGQTGGEYRRGNTALPVNLARSVDLDDTIGAAERQQVTAIRQRFDAGPVLRALGVIGGTNRANLTLPGRVQLHNQPASRDEYDVAIGQRDGVPKAGALGVREDSLLLAVHFIQFAERGYQRVAVGQTLTGDGVA